MKLLMFAISVLIACAGPALSEQVVLDEGDLAALDQDGDGVVSKAEFEDFAKFAFEQIDKDSSGALSPDEVDDYLIGDAFKILDDDRNGTVSASEFSTQLNEDFTAADKDGNGALN